MGFPHGFWWGTAASSTQTEGAAPRSDYHRWESLGHVPPSGQGNGFDTRYAEDFALYAHYGLNHHRLSLEWARLEPEQGRHDPAAVEHYREVLAAAKAAGLTTWVCLHHFSLPGWFADDLGGFVDDRARGLHWCRHVDWVGETFGDLVDGWKPINEPVAYAGGGWLLGAMPPGRTDLGAFFEALEATHLANHDAWRLLRGAGTPVMTIMNLAPLFVGVRNRDDPREADAAVAMHDAFDQVFWRSWTRALRDGVLDLPGRPTREIPEMAGSFDVIGFSYYFANAVFADGSTGPYPESHPRNDMGGAIWPEGLSLCLERLHEELPGRPLCVAECGLGTDDDTLRQHYLDECLARVGSAVDDGIDVRGFFHWTGVDNYEWSHGYDVRFGLFDRDRNVKGSAEVARRWAASTAGGDTATPAG
jgi:beta-glucosidase